MNTPITTTSSLLAALPGHESFEDVTQLIALAAEAMQTGQVIAMSHFTMLDAMNAIEIMDPRMDNGMVGSSTPSLENFTGPSAGNSYPASIPPVDFHVGAPLRPEEIAWISDRAIAAEMGWHEGWFMSQTVHTLQYVHDLNGMSSFLSPHQSDAERRQRPKELIPTVLRPLVIGLIKTCDLVWRQLMQRFVYDTEDFHSEKFDVSLGEHFQTQQVIDQLGSAESWLNASPELPYRDALLVRVRLRKSILRAFSLFNVTSEGTQITHITEALSHLDSLHSQYSVPTPDPTSPACAAFDPAISRKLSAITPLKVIPLMEQEKAWAGLRQMLEGLREVYVLAHETGNRTLSWMTMLFSRARSPVLSLSRNAFVRSVTWEVLRSQGKQWFIAMVVSELTTIPDRYLPTIANAASEHLLRIGVIHQPGFLLAQLVDLENRLYEVVDHLFLTLNQNRPRMRRNFAKVLLAWHRLEDDVQALMTTIERALRHVQIPSGITDRLPLVVHYLRDTLIVDHVLSGFELGLYHPSEYPFMYWHLSNILLNQISTVEDLMWIAEQNGETASLPAAYLRSQVIWCEALQVMCEARFQMLVITPPESRPLFPQLDESRQRANLERRFDWSFPPPEDNMELQDIGQPDWDAYQAKVAELQADEPSEVATSQLQMLAGAKTRLVQLRERSRRETATEFCEASFYEEIDRLKGSCTRLSVISQQRQDNGAGTDGAHDGTMDPLLDHVWFPVLPGEEQA